MLEIIASVLGLIGLITTSVSMISIIINKFNAYKVLCVGVILLAIAMILS